jgi:two-component system cell cycle sensor histidine kinase/response regulator CckA
MTMKDQAKTNEQLIGELAGLRQRIAELEAAETERKQAEEALRGALTELTVIHQNVPVAMMLVDRDRRVRKVNGAVALFAGRPAEEMLGLRGGEALRCLHHLDDPQGCGFGPTCATCTVRLAVLDTFATHESKQDLEAWLSFPRGGSVEERCLLLSTAYLQMDDTEQVLVCAQDITDRKRAEEALRESGARYQAIVEAFDGLIYICSQDYRIEFMNKQLLERTGYDGTGELCYKVLHDRDSICPWCVNDRAFAGETVRWEVQSPKDNRWYYVVNTPIYHTDGSMSKQAMILDITERKQAEDELRASEARFRTFVDHAADAFFLHDEWGTILDVNRQACESLGYSREELVGMTPDDLNASIDHSFIEQTKARLNAEEVVAFDTWSRRKDGSVFPVEVRTRLLWQGKRRLAVSLVRDMTERKQAEEALAESERKYRFITEKMTDAVWLMDMAFKPTFISPSVTRITGYTLEELQALSLNDLLTPASFESVMKTVATELAPERLAPRPYERSVTVELEFRRKDGSPLCIESTITLLRDSEGDPIGLMGVGRDITERKQAQEALTLFRSLIDHANDIIEVADPETGRFLDMNERACLAHGYTREEYLALTVPQINPVVAARSWKKTVEEVRRSGSLIRESQHRHKDGSIFPVEININYVRLDRDYVLSVVRDITERKRTEEALRQSEERFRALYEDNPSMYFMVDAQGMVLSVNPFGADQLGYAVEELIGQSVLNVFYPDDREAVQQQLTTCLEHPGKVQYWELRKVRQNGSMLWVREAARAVQGADGRSVVLIVCEDITERRRAEAEREHLLAQIREQAHRVQEVVDTVPEGVLLLDSDCRVGLTNPLGQQNLVTLAGARVGDKLTRLGDRPLVELLTSPPKGLWHEVATESRSFQVLARPVENDATSKGWVLVIRDVTQQYESERRIQQQERLAAVGQLAAGIAHDFNNIMAVIVLHAQMTARSAALSDRDRGQLATIDEQAHHATRLIQQILDFSRRAVLERQPLDLLPLLKEQVQLLKRTLPEHIAIRLNYGHGEYTVNADPTRMQQMMMNLAVNARDAMPEGGVLSIALERITVKPGASLPLPELVAGDWIELSVADTGIGVLPEVLPHIFEPFYTTKPPDQGSGLGLAQVYGIVAQHEGHIDVEAQAGAGTTFTIYLPALAVPPVTPLSLDVSIVPQGKGEVVLVVEDNVTLRATLRETLVEWGYQVREAANGVQALALLEEPGDVADLVLSDVVMPEMGGVALVHAMREREWVIPVILLSGYPQERDLTELRAYGVRAWLYKPPSMEELAKVVARALSTD